MVIGAEDLGVQSFSHALKILPLFVTSSQICKYLPRNTCLVKWECEGGGLRESYSLLSIWQHTCPY